MSTIHVGQTTLGATGLIEFTEGEIPPIIAQSDRAGARLSADERYLAMNTRLKLILASLLGDITHIDLAQIWDSPCYDQLIKPGFALCQTTGPQMLRNCRLRGDLLQRSFDLLLVAEPSTQTVLQILFETVAPVFTREQMEELRRLRSIVDLAPVLISIKDRQSVVRLTNQMFSILDGPDPEEYLNRSVYEIFPRDIAEKLWSNDLAVFQTGKVVEAEEVVKHRDGSIHTYLTYKYPLISPSGDIGEVCAISTDITARKYYEQKALEAMQKAEEANQIKSDFLAHMSHEIRTPLTVIRGYADLIARKGAEDPESFRQWISSVVRASKQLEHIINDILDLSKVEAGIIELEKNPIDLSQLLNELESSFALKAQEKRLNFQVKMREGVPPIIVTDALRLRQVLDNLVSNALKFTAQGSVEVLVEAATTGSARLLQIWVRDTGIGLSAEEQKKLFQPFVQADGSIARKYGGTGLGLVLAKRLAQLLGGDVQIYRSTKGAGTEMLITLTITPTENLEMRRAPCLPVVMSSDGELAQRLREKRLLLVEDADDIRELLRYFLVQNGARVATASLGEEALALLDAETFDVVLMDLQMPVLDGMQTMAAMRTRGFCGAIVALTAHALRGEREKCLQAGFDDFLTKPIQLPEVLNVLEKTIAAKMT